MNRVRSQIETFCLLNMWTCIVCVVDEHSFLWIIYHQFFLSQRNKTCLKILHDNQKQWKNRIEAKAMINILWWKYLTNTNKVEYKISCPQIWLIKINFWWNKTIIYLYQWIVLLNVYKFSFLFMNKIFHDNV